MELRSPQEELAQVAHDARSWATALGEREDAAGFQVTCSLLDLIERLAQASLGLGAPAPTSHDLYRLTMKLSWVVGALGAATKMDEFPTDTAIECGRRVADVIQAMDALGCEHDWHEVEAMADGAVKCRKCSVPGDRRADGEVFWPAT